MNTVTEPAEPGVSAATPAGQDGWRRQRRAEAAAQRRRRRALAIDLALGVILAIVIIAALPGLGVVAWFALPLLLLGLVWLGVERLLVRTRFRTPRRLPD